MPDPFFASTKQRKRKRSTSAPDADSRAAGTSKKFAKKDGAKSRPGAPAQKKGKVDEELDSDRTDEDGGIDDMDLRHGMDEGEEGSGEEDQDETPAEKRLRLAQLYLDTVKEGLGMWCHIFLAIQANKPVSQLTGNLTRPRSTRNLSQVD